jgi:hypothetical protein
LVAAFFDNGTLFFAAEVAVAVANRLDFEGEGSDETHFAVIGGTHINKVQRNNFTRQEEVGGKRVLSFEDQHEKYAWSPKNRAWTKKMIFPTTKKPTFPVLNLVVWYLPL